MTRRASIKETGEDLSDQKWQRFEAAVGIDRDRSGGGEVRSDQPYREEAEHPEDAKAQESRPDDAGDPRRGQDASKTTKRTE